MRKSSTPSTNAGPHATPGETGMPRLINIVGPGCKRGPRTRGRDRSGPRCKTAGASRLPLLFGVCRSTASGDLGRRVLEIGLEQSHEAVQRLDRAVAVGLEDQRVSV